MAPLNGTTHFCHWLNLMPQDLDGGTAIVAHGFLNSLIGLAGFGCEEIGKKEIYWGKWQHARLIEYLKAWWGNAEQFLLNTSLNNPLLYSLCFRMLQSAPLVHFGGPSPVLWARLLQSAQILHECWQALTAHVRCHTQGSINQKSESAINCIVKINRFNLWKIYSFVILTWRTKGILLLVLLYWWDFMKGEMDR